MGDDRNQIVRRLIFGGSDPIAEVRRFCERQVGDAIEAVLFEEVSVGVTVGAELGDGRRVVVKAHHPRETRERLRAVVHVQRAHHAAGFPCPRPLAGPAPLGAGFGTVEELLDAGEPRDPHDPAVRRAMAELLAEHLELAGRQPPDPALAGGFDLFAGDGPWPAELHAPIFDFGATAGGAEWIDAIAVEVRPAAAAAAHGPVVAHMDWSGEHFRFAAGGGPPRVTAVYDWDSLALRPEHHALGVATATFTAFPALGVDAAPAPAEAAAFLGEHSAARQTPLSAAERERIAATATYVAAYVARCEHALGEAGPFTRALARYGAGWFSGTS